MWINSFNNEKQAGAGQAPCSDFFDGENRAVRRRKAGGVSSEYSI